MTIRTIVILRHAKAEDLIAGADQDRPLAARGHADAAAAGAWLAHHNHLPELVLCSPATRTRQTWHDVALTMAERGADEGVTPAAPFVRYERQLYEGSTEDLLALLRSANADTRTILLVGHNPLVSVLSRQLDPTQPEPTGLRTCGLAVHRVTGDWATLGRDGAPLTGAHTARS